MNDEEYLHFHYLIHVHPQVVRFTQKMSFDAKGATPVILGVRGLSRMQNLSEIETLGESKKNPRI